MDHVVNLCGINVNLKNVRAVTFCDPSKTNSILANDMKKQFPEFVFPGISILLILFQDGTMWEMADFDLSMYDYLTGVLQGKPTDSTEFSFAAETEWYSDQDRYVQESFVAKFLNS